jgi:type II secretory pathway pseudopilin PulG
MTTASDEEVRLRAFEAAHEDAERRFDAARREARRASLPDETTPITSTRGLARWVWRRLDPRARRARWVRAAVGVARHPAVRAILGWPERAAPSIEDEAPRLSFEAPQAGLRFAIAARVPALETATRHGDYHFAAALAEALVRQGHSARVDLLPDGPPPRARADDVVVVLRGLARYEPTPGPVHLLWVISHPELVTNEELAAFDQVFVASTAHARALADAPTRRPVEALLQCTDPHRFYPDPDPTLAHGVLFVGNSKGIHRPIVHDAVERGLPLTVYGGDWSGLIPDAAIAGRGVPNRTVRRHYSSCKVLLNDHWPRMRSLGYLSNRLFDAAACGACIVSDPAIGLEAVFGDAVTTYTTPQELEDRVRALLLDEGRRRTLGAAARRAVAAHDFDHRARVLVARAKALLGARDRSGP